MDPNDFDHPYRDLSVRPPLEQASKRIAELETELAEVKHAYGDLSTQFTAAGPVLETAQALGDYFDRAERAVTNGGVTPPWDGMQFRTLRKRLARALR